MKNPKHPVLPTNIFCFNQYNQKSQFFGRVQQIFKPPCRLQQEQTDRSVTDLAAEAECRCTCAIFVSTVKSVPCIRRCSDDTQICLYQAITEECGGCQVLPAHLKFVRHLKTAGKTCVPAVDVVSEGHSPHT